MPTYNPLINEIDIGEIQRYAGLSRCQDFSTARLAQARQDALLLSKSKGLWQLYDYDSSSGIIKGQTPLPLTGRKLLNHLSTSEKIVVMAVTIGTAVEAAIDDEFNKGNYTTALLLDAAATAAVETAADQLNGYINHLAKTNGYSTVYRFSPGYGDWAITVQPELLALLETDTIGLTCTSSCMLVPRKSVTAVIGWSPISIENKNTCRRGCDSCSQPDCLSRKK